MTKDKNPFIWELRIGLHNQVHFIRISPEVLARQSIQAVADYATGRSFTVWESEAQKHYKIQVKNMERRYPHSKTNKNAYLIDTTNGYGVLFASIHKIKGQP